MSSLIVVDDRGWTVDHTKWVHCCIKNFIYIRGFHSTEVAFVLLIQPPRVQISSLQKYYAQWIFERSALRDKGDAQTREQYLIEIKKKLHLHQPGFWSDSSWAWVGHPWSQAWCQEWCSASWKNLKTRNQTSQVLIIKGCLLNAEVALIKKHWVRISKLLFWWECSNAPYRNALYKTSPRCP